MSYVESLDWQSRKRYREKLEAAGLSLEDEPYSANDRFCSDVTLWPKIEYGHIFAYFIVRPGTYTQQQLLSWKQMEAYNYFESGYVREVLSMAFGSGSSRCVVLKAKVNPSQRSPDKAHEPWIIAKLDGHIICAHCTCKAGLGEGCSHIAAVMFKVECAVRLGYTSSTAQVCKWNETFCNKIQPFPIVSIQFKRPKRGRGTDDTESSHRSTKVRRSLEPHDKEGEELFLSDLKNILPSAVIFSSLAPLSPPAPRPDSVIRKLPQPLSALKRSEYHNMSGEELEAACEDVFQRGIIVSQEEATYLEEVTRLQSQSLLWFEHRLGRITASRFHAVKFASLDPPPASLLQQFMEKKSLNHVPAIRWGIDHEEAARKAYLKLANERHANLQCSASGLHVNPKFPHLGASPDGLVSCDCCGEGLIEIKCPFKHRDKHPHEVQDLQFCLQEDEDGRKCLSKHHKYFYQVQGQLAICRRGYCDFICWTERGIHVERILADLSHFAETKPKLDSFFKKALLPLLLTGRSTEQPTKRPDTYCWCGGGDTGWMVACDNQNCKITWFHFKCAGLVRKPRGKWYCSDSCKSQDI